MAHWGICLLTLIVVLATGTNSELMNPIKYADILRNYNNNANYNDNDEQPLIIEDDYINDNNNNNNNINIIDDKTDDSNKKLSSTSLIHGPNKYDWINNINRQQSVSTLPISPLKTIAINNLKDKRNNRISRYSSLCTCTAHYELFDLGSTHYPRFLSKAVCSNRHANGLKCWRGSRCKEVPYNVHVLTHRQDDDLIENDQHASMLPDTLQKSWKFITFTIAAACQCSA